MATVYPVKARRTGTDATALGEFEPTDTLPDSVVAASNVTQHFPGGFPPAAHTHSAADIVSGNLAYARLPVGTGSWDLGNPADILTFLRGFRVNGLLQAGSEVHIASANAIRWKDGVTGTERATQRIFGSDWAIEVGGFEGFRVLAGPVGVVIEAQRKFYLDGVGGVPGDTYIYEQAANSLAFFVGGANRVVFNVSSMVVATGYAIYLDSGVDTWIDQNSNDIIRMVCQGAVAGQFDRVADPADGETTLHLRTNHGGVVALRRVLIGAADSGGVGYRQMRIAN